MTMNAYAADAAQQAPNLISQFAPLIVIFAIFYFLLIRPQQKRQKQHREKLNNIAKGDTVITAGGIKAKVLKVVENDLEIEISKDVIVSVVRSTVLDVVVDGEKVPAKKVATKKTTQKAAKKPAKKTTKKDEK